MKHKLANILPLFDTLSIPFVLAAAHLPKLVRRIGVQRLSKRKTQLLHVGVFPIRSHYYEPMFNANALRFPLNAERDLFGIEWNIDRQLSLLKKFTFNEEMQGIGSVKNNVLDFHFGNGAFELVDAEFLYNIIRAKKPQIIFEIGSGNSTLMAQRAVLKNTQENPAYHCKHVCIEPYEMSWLERTGVTVLR